MAIRRKGKVKMKLWFDDNDEYEVAVSHTKVTLPYNKKEYELVFVHGLSDDKPMILLTNGEIHSKEDLIKVVRLYFYRWRFEEYFRSKKQDYQMEKFRVRTLKSINVLNMMLTIHMGHIGKLVENIDKKLLTIKRSQSLRNKVIVWMSQIAKGIKEWQEIEVKEKYKQMQLTI